MMWIVYGIGMGFMLGRFAEDLKLSLASRDGGALGDVVVVVAAAVLWPVAILAMAMTRLLKKQR